VNQIYLRPWII